MFMSYLFFLEKLCGTEKFYYVTIISDFRIYCHGLFYGLLVLMSTLPVSAKLCCAMGFFSSELFFFSIIHLSLNRDFVSVSLVSSM